MDVGKTDSLLQDKIKAENKYTNYYRRIGWALSFVGHILITPPLTRDVRFIPLIGYLYPKAPWATVFVFQFLWWIMLNSFVSAIASLIYRPLFGSLLLFVVGIVICIFSISDELFN